MPHPSTKKTLTAIGVLLTTVIWLHKPGIAQAEDIDLPGLHAQDEIRRKCQESGGRYFEDLDFGAYGCTNESRRSGLHCSLIALTCTLHLPDQQQGRRL